MIDFTLMTQKKSLCATVVESFSTKQWEYSLHRRSSHTDIKPFKCGICNDAAFPTVGRLNNPPEVMWPGKRLLLSAMWEAIPYEMESYPSC